MVVGHLLVVVEVKRKTMKSELIRRYKELFMKVDSPFRTTNGDRRYRVLSEDRGAEENTIIIHEEIGFWGVESRTIEDDLSRMNGDVLVRINSPGGDVFDGMAIYNLLKQYDRGKVTTQIDGEAASAAGIIFMAGEERIAPEPSILMLHEAWALIAGNGREMEEFASILREIDGQLLKVLQSVSGKEAGEVKEAFEKEMWLGPEAAKDWGFVTSIMTYDKDDQVFNERPGFDLSAFGEFLWEPSTDPESGDMPERKVVERALRNAGLSRNQARAFYASGKVALTPEDEDSIWAAAKSLELAIRGVIT
jgi:ATP-dependent protease ClpP protease subunit